MRSLSDVSSVSSAARASASAQLLLSAPNLQRSSPRHRIERKDAHANPGTLSPVRLGGELFSGLFSLVRYFRHTEPFSEGRRLAKTAMRSDIIMDH
jgi:hypothetical protein